MADYSSYARVVLSNSESISKLIRKYSIVPIETKYVNTVGMSHLAVLTSKQITEAFLNPQSTIKPSISAYSNITQAYREIIAIQQEAYEQQLFVEESIRKIKEKYTGADKTQQKFAEGSMSQLEKYYKELTTIQKNLAELEHKIQGFQQDLAGLTTDHDQDWENFRKEMLAEISKDLEQRNVPLTDLERQELERQESWAEILKRFQELSLSVPNYINIQKPDLATYFELKVYLAIHSSLSRRMLPNLAEDIEKL